MEIITDEPTLRTVSADTSMEEVEKLDLVKKIKVALKTGWTQGYGLAAIQIGIPLRFAWFKFGGQEFTLLNPSIVQKSGQTKQVKEACMSIPNEQHWMRRHLWIVYESGGRRYKAKSIKAQIIQHEIDHMNGKLVRD